MTRMHSLALFIILASAGWTNAQIRFPEVPLKEKAERGYRQDIETAEKNYRMALAKVIAQATAIEIYLLDFETKKVEVTSTDVVFGTTYRDLGHDEFSIRPYRAYAKILKRKKLNGREMDLLMPGLQGTIALEDNRGGVLCHFPIHGIRVWVRDDKVFESSICYHCSNYYMTYPDGSVGWTHLTSPVFKKVMHELLPIPQAELDRFNAKYPTDEKPEK